MKRKIFIVPLLWMAGLIYGVITSFRNFLYNSGIFEVYEPPVFSIGVGNLSVGGTGKTPMIAKLISIFKGKKIAVLSRGYGRNTRGFFEVNEVNPEKFGDEMSMLFQNFSSKAFFFVSENRKKGVQALLKLYPDTDLILFDDVFQHRAIKPSLMLLLTDYNRPFFKDKILPFGRLRESVKSILRADVLLVTKYSKDQKFDNQLADKLHDLSFTKPVYFAISVLKEPQNTFGDPLQADKSIVLLSGLGNNGQFRTSMEENFTIIDHFEFADHYKYSRQDLLKIIEKYPNSDVVTTEKDFVKIHSLLSKEELRNIFVQKLEIEVNGEFMPFSELLREAYQSYLAKFTPK